MLSQNFFILFHLAVPGINSMKVEVINTKEAESGQLVNFDSPKPKAEIN